MKSIWKYTFTGLTCDQTFDIPVGGKVIHAGQDPQCSSAVSIWVEVETENEPVQRDFLLMGTGHSLPGNYEISCRYVGSAHCDPFIWHVYEKVTP